MIEADLSPELSTENVENWAEEQVRTKLVRWLCRSIDHEICACARLQVICNGLKLEDDDRDRWSTGTRRF